MKEYGSQETLLDSARPSWGALFITEFRSFARGDVIVKMSELRRKGVSRSDLKIIGQNPDLTAITKDVEALNDA